jgi:hypothetical protein
VYVPVADHLVQSFITFAGASYRWYANVRSGTVGDKYEGYMGRHLNGKTLAADNGN